MNRPLLTSACLALTLGCQVVHPRPTPQTGAADLPTLRRASVALQDRIRTEQDHVAQYNHQLRDLRSDEERIYARIQDSEATVQQLQTDLDGVLDDVDQARGELREESAQRDAGLSRLAELRAAIEAQNHELDSLRVAAERASRQLEAARRWLRAVQAHAKESAQPGLLVLVPVAAQAAAMVRATGGMGQWSAPATSWMESLAQLPWVRRMGSESGPRGAGKGG